MTLPSVSVILPAYNRAHLMIPTMESVARQTLRPFEVIVVDDGSQDDTAQVARKTIERLDLPGRVVTIENIGCEPARDHGLQLAEGELLAPLDTDDIWEPDYLMTCARLLAENPHVHLVISNFSFVGEDPEAPSSHTKFDLLDQRDQLLIKEIEPGIFETGENLVETLIQETPVHPSCLVMRNATYRRIGPYSQMIASRTALSVDWEFHLRFAKNAGPFLAVTEPLVRVRKHGDNLSGVVYKQTTGETRVLQHLLANYDLSPRERALATEQLAERSWTVGYHFFQSGQMAEVGPWMKQSLAARFSGKALFHLLASHMPAGLTLALRKLKWRLEGSG